MTKEYLKMADFVKHGVTVTPHGFVAGVNYESASGELIVRDVYAALSHAINSHDELVAEVERLLESNKRMADAIWGKWQREGVMANESSQDKADTFRDLYLCEPFTHPE